MTEAPRIDALDCNEPAFSVVVPAHNESAVIERCLTALIASEDNFEICVVSNGSNDDTVSLARTILADRPHSTVVEIEAASKIAALREGDRRCISYPRIYLDADVTVDSDTVRSMASMLGALDGPAVGAPRIDVDFSRSSAIVRGYHRVWLRMPYVADGVIGSGFYAVNEAGGARVGEFPDVLNDDEYVRSVFAPNERHIGDGQFVSIAPSTVTSMVKRRARWDVGNRQLATVVDGAGSSSTAGSLRDVARAQGISVFDIASYVGITVAGKLLARYRNLRGTASQWSTDTTSRT